MIYFTYWARRKYLSHQYLPSDEFGIIPSPEILEKHIDYFKDLKNKLKQQ